MKTLLLEQAAAAKRVTQADIYSALESLYQKGVREIRANTLANALWPTARSNNSRGQTFNLSSGVAGRMLRKCPAVFEIRQGEWEILTWILREYQAVESQGTPVGASSGRPKNMIGANTLITQ